MPQSFHPLIESRRDQMFPVLEPTEIDRLTRFGERRFFAAGERLVATGEIAPGAFVILAGQVDVMQNGRLGHSQLIVTHGPGSFMIDTLINNAGIFIAKPFTEYTEADYVAILGVNVAGFFHITQFAVAEMEKQGSGHVVQITTSLVDHAIAGVPSVLASLTKGGLAAATKSLAIEYARRGIRVNAVAPGIIKSPMNPVDTYAQLDALHPVGHMGEISDIVGAILYLESAPFVTGEILHTDGGQSAGH